MPTDMQYKDGLRKDKFLNEKIAGYSTVPVINAMTDSNHPCEILSDLYALSKIRRNFRR